MSIEIELKFALQQKAMDSIQQKLLNYAVHSSTLYHLTNDYYDTAQADLRGHDLGLRIRSVAQQYEMTLKGKAQGVAGLQQRIEYNIPLLNSELDLSLLPSEVWPKGLEVATLQSQLHTIFSTNFQREVWKVCYKKSEIEVALDQGKIQSGSQSLPILELELELLKGDVLELLEFAPLILSDGMYLSDISKAARGYLLSNDKRSEVPLRQALSVVLEYPLPQQLPRLLKIWQQFDDHFLLANDGIDKFFLEQLCQTSRQLLIKLMASGCVESTLSLHTLASELLQFASSLSTRQDLLHDCAMPAYQSLKLRLLQIAVQCSQISLG